MEKKGQTAVFFAIGLIIVISMILLGTANDSNTSKKDVGIERVQIDDANLRGYVQSCADTTAKNAVFYLGFTGGNLKNDAFQQFFVHDSFYRIPYYYYAGNLLILTEDGFKKMVLAKYVDENLRKCTSDFKPFENTRIVDSAPKTIVELSDSEVIFNVDYPVSINRGFQARNLDVHYISNVKARLKEIIKIAQDIVADEVENDRYIHWDYMTDVSSRNYNITAYTEKDDTIIYRIIDLENEIDKEPYIFQFANRIKVKK